MSVTGVIANRVLTKVALARKWHDVAMRTGGCRIASADHQQLADV
jgi:hypothetical protein